MTQIAFGLSLKSPNPTPYKINCKSNNRDVKTPDPDFFHPGSNINKEGEILVFFCMNFTKLYKFF
jgi:hypothetical protein